MPCEEKRTESNRNQFFEEDCKDVDLVLTTEELLSVIKLKEIDVMKLDPLPIPLLFTNYDPERGKVTLFFFFEVYFDSCLEMKEVQVVVFWNMFLSKLLWRCMEYRSTK